MRLAPSCETMDLMMVNAPVSAKIPDQIAKEARP